MPALRHSATAFRTSSRGGLDLPDEPNKGGAVLKLGKTSFVFQGAVRDLGDCEEPQCPLAKLGGDASTSRRNASSIGSSRPLRRACEQSLSTASGAP